VTCTARGRDSAWIHESASMSTGVHVLRACERGGTEKKRGKGTAGTGL
jgi:hypothetical protein